MIIIITIIIIINCPFSICEHLFLCIPNSVNRELKGDFVGGIDHIITATHIYTQLQLLNC